MLGIDKKAIGKECIGNSVVYFCHDGKGNFIMAKRSQQARDEKGRWDIGAGAIEFGETVEAALKKEILEEYCCEVKSYEFLGFRDVRRVHEGVPTHWITFDFKVLIDPSQAKIGEPHKFDDLRFCRLETLPPKDEIHSQLPYFLEKYAYQLTN